MLEIMSAKTKIALLIDGDNVQSSIVEKLLNVVAQYGKPIIKKVFLNKSSLPQWEVPVNQFALTPLWVPNNVSGKNAADIALVIDTMEMLYERQDLEFFCIVSSDSDFTGLAKKIVEKGKKVIGIGEQKTPESFRNACDPFIYIEDLPEHQNKTDILPEEVDEDSTSLSPVAQSFDSLFVRAYEVAAQNTDASIPLLQIKEAMNALDPNFQSSELQNTRQLAEKVKQLEGSYPNQILVVDELLDTKPVTHCVQIRNLDLFKFIEAYQNSSAVDYNKWLRLSIFLHEIQKYPAYKSGFTYRGAKRLKAVKLLIQDFNEIIEVKEENDGNSLIHFIRLRQ